MSIPTNDSVEKIDLTNTDWKSSREFFQSLADELHELDNVEERYNFTWVGKRKSVIEAGAPINKTLRPCEKESKNFDTTENLYIEGDNLDALKLLQESYLGKVKMIYIDPPYNTGKDFVYRDNFTADNAEYQVATGKKDTDGNTLVAEDEFKRNERSAGRFHSDWLSMMYPRLKLARNLLSNDGVIFISIDDNEQANLKKLCDEVFGEENFVNSFIVKRRTKSLNSQFATISRINVGFEYILAYSKSNDFIYTNPTKPANDSHQEGYWNSFWNNADRPTMRYHIENISISKGQWKWSKERAMRALENYHKFQKSGIANLRDYWEANKDNFFDENGIKMEFIMPTDTTVKYWVTPSETTIMDTNLMEFYVNDDSGKRNYSFDTVKSKDLIIKLITMVAQPDDLILDFFSGSGTTAHAVMQLNAEDGGNRKFILVQLGEETPEDSEARKAGYKTIPEIARERIRRAGEKIIQENSLLAGKFDVGFRTLKVDESNTKEDIYRTPDNTSQADLSEPSDKLTENLKIERSDLDLLFGVLCQSALDYNRPIKKETIGDAVIYCYDYSAPSTGLIACFAEKLSEEIIKEIAAKKPQTAVFRDSSFADSSAKVNCVEIFRVQSPETKVKVI